MTGAAQRIDEERVCIDSLVAHLKAIGDAGPISAQEEPKDPPDYWLFVDKRKFAVEITSIVVDQGYSALCRSLHYAVKRQCQLLSPPAGTFRLEVNRRPDIPRRGSRQWAALVNNAVAYVRTASGDRPSSQALLHDDSGYLTISKVADHGNSVAMYQGGEVKWEDEAQRELSVLIGDAIEKKRTKLRRAGVLDACADIILALYDAYGFADPSDAKAAFSDLKGYDWLHSIYWAASFSDRANVLYPESPGRAGAFLYSRNGDWR